MTLDEIKAEVRKYYYMEDDHIIDVTLASVIANRLQLGDPVWLILVGASSGGKSQILRPIAMTDPKYIHRIDDITENTFLSGSVGKGGSDMSLLNRIGASAMITISDLTVLFSRSPESKMAILSQFRMLYDGEMIKHVGNKDKPVSWKGYMGIIAGSTPSIYSHFEEVADMGERFMYYRMKKYDERKATQIALGRGLYGKELDEKLSALYGDFIKDIVKGADISKLKISDENVEQIIDIAVFSEKIRTANKVDKVTREIERIPTSAMPMRTALQLLNIAKALMLMRGRELDDVDMRIVAWLGYSLANEEKRTCLRVLSTYNEPVSTQKIADIIGLGTRVVGTVLQNLASVGVLERSGDSGTLKWKYTSKKDLEFVMSIEGVNSINTIDDRILSLEELDTTSDVF